jgi:hypothetical protein
MTTAGRIDSATSNGGHWTRSAPPLLHLRGTDYGLLIHGLRKASEARREAGDLTGAVLPVT